MKPSRFYVVDNSFSTGFTTWSRCKTDLNRASWWITQCKKVISSSGFSSSWSLFSNLTFFLLNLTINPWRHLQVCFKLVSADDDTRHFHRVFNFSDSIAKNSFTISKLSIISLTKIKSWVVSFLFSPRAVVCPCLGVWVKWCGDDDITSGKTNVSYCNDVRNLIKLYFTTRTVYNNIEKVKTSIWGSNSPKRKFFAKNFT